MVICSARWHLGGVGPIKLQVPFQKRGEKKEKKEKKEEKNDAKVHLLLKSVPNEAAS